MIAHGFFPWFFFFPLPAPYYAPPPYYPPPPPPAYYEPYHRPAPPVTKDEYPPGTEPGGDGCPVEDCRPPDGFDPQQNENISPRHPRSDGMPVDPPPNSRWYYEPGHPSFPYEK